MIVGITGHTNLTESSHDLVRRQMLHVLQPHSDRLVGLTCLARGADQLFADAVLRLGGELHVIAPSRDYFTSIRKPADRERCAAFLRRAAGTVTLDHEAAGPEAYLAASRYLIDRSDLVVAVWDGSAPSGTGGTADAVAYAHDIGRTTVRIWPDGAARS